MKVFKWNPETGRKGEQVGSARNSVWTDQSIAYQAANNMIEPVAHAEPWFPGDFEAHTHVDGGYEADAELISLQHATEWRCFCTGEDSHGTWHWNVIAPKNAIKGI